MLAVGGSRRVRSWLQRRCIWAATFLHQAQMIMVHIDSG